MDVLEETPDQSKKKKKMRGRSHTHVSVIQPPPYLLGDGGPGGVQDSLSDRVLAGRPLQLQADVLQDAELQGGQRRLQVGPADVPLRQPLEQRYVPHRQLVAVDQSPDLIKDLRGNLLCDLTEDAGESFSE